MKHVLFKYTLYGHFLSHRPLNFLCLQSMTSSISLIYLLGTTSSLKCWGPSQGNKCGSPDMKGPNKPIKKSKVNLCLILVNFYLVNTVLCIFFLKQVLKNFTNIGQNYIKNQISK